MKIVSLAAAFPSRVVSNEDVVDKITAHSPDLKVAGTRVGGIISRMLTMTGAKSRRWCSRDETSLGLTMRAASDALADAEKVGKGEVGLLIVASVYGELIEPATSNVLAHALGLDRVECFDLKEACDGWAKAVKLADALLKSGMYRRIMVVNTEFSMAPGYALYPRLFNLSSLEQLEWRFPAYTIGEAATAMIVEGDAERPWKFHNKTRNDLFDLCTVTPPWYSGTIPGRRVAKDGAGLFTSWAALLSGHGIPLAVETFKESGIQPAEADVLFTHGSSKKDWAEIARQIGLERKIYDMYADYGNVVSAAVPAAMALAVKDGTLRRGMRVAVLVASAGMSFSTASFVF